MPVARKPRVSTQRRRTSPRQGPRPPLALVERMQVAAIGLVNAYIDRLMRELDPELRQRFDDAFEIGDVGGQVALGEGFLRTTFHAVDRQAAEDLARAVPIPASRVLKNSAKLERDWVKSNTELIQLEQRARVEVRKVVEGPLREGIRVEEVRKRIEERLGVVRSRAELIARDQTLKLYGQIQQQRQEQAGIKEYTWSASDDERTRPDHAELDGSTQRWDDPPIVDKRSGRKAHPGGDFQCRCAAVPILPEGEDEQENPPEPLSIEPTPPENDVEPFVPAKSNPLAEEVLRSAIEAQQEAAAVAAENERIRALAKQRAEREALERQRRLAEEAERARVAAEERAAAERERLRLEQEALETARAEAIEAERQRVAAEQARFEAEAQRARAEVERLARLAVETSTKPVEVKIVPKFEGTEPKAKTAKMWRATSQSKYDSMSLPEKTAINAFVHSDYAYLRPLQEGRSIEEVASERFAPSVARLRELKSMLPSLKAAQKKLSVANPTQFGTLYRGLALRPEQFEEALRSSEFVFKASSNSTSYSYETALGFASGQYQRQAVVLRIKSAREGAFVGFKENTNRGETEVVLSNRKFRVTGKTRSTLDDVLILDLEETSESALRADAAEPLTHKLPLAPAHEREGRFGSDGWDVEFS